MSTNKRRSTSKLTTTPSKKRPLTLAQEEAKLRDQIHILENRVALAPAELSATDSWRRSPSPSRAMPTSAKARQTRERTSVLIELAFGTILLLGAALWLWQRFGK